MLNPRLRAAMDAMKEYPQDALDEAIRPRLEQIENNTGPMWRGDFDQRQLDRVRAKMGITRPVFIERGDHHRVGLNGVLWGQWGYDPDRADFHTISILPDIPLDVAEEIFAHELTHALQLERDGFEEVQRQNADEQLKRMLFGMDAYYEAPHEVEAQKNADEIAHTLGVLRAGRQES